MRGLVPRIHVLREAAKAWMAGSSPAMTAEEVTRSVGTYGVFRCG
jgi:hypothetical protein